MQEEEEEETFTNLQIRMGGKLNTLTRICN
jgi:hypothetical protein